MQDLIILKQWNLHKALRHAQANKGVSDAYPEHIALTALSRCNQRCITCIVDQTSKEEVRWEAVLALKPALSFARFICLTGGEPFLYRGIENFFALCQETGCQAVIQTNGSLLDDKRRRLVVGRQVSALKISCDGATPATYNRIRKGGNFDRLVDSILLLTRLKQEMGSLLPLLEFNFVAMRSNIEELPKLVFLASKLGVRAVNVFLLMAHTPALAEESLYFDQELADAQFMRAGIMARQVGVEARLPPLFSSARRAAFMPSGPNQCVSPWTSMTVNINGDAAICCGGAGVAGNLYRDDFPAIWNHPKRVAIRETVNTDRELPCCRSCRQGKPNPESVYTHIPNREVAHQVLRARGLPLPGEQSEPVLPPASSGADPAARLAV